MDLTFSGAGFMGCYYFGVVDCWQKYIPRDRVNRVAGASAGSLIAAYYLMDLPLSTCLREIIEMTEGIRSRSLGVFDRNHQMVDMLPKLLDRLFPDDAHKRVSGRLFVCMTRLKDMKKVLVSEFDSKKDLIDALNCSCFIPVWSGNHVSTYKGVKHIDGGFSDNLPVFDENTIRICCFAGQTDISPYDRVKSELFSANLLNTPLYFNFANCRRAGKALFPPPASFILDLLERGFHDTKQFILTNDLIQCGTCYGKGHLRDLPMFRQHLQVDSTATGSANHHHHHHLTISPSVTPALSRVGSQRVKSTGPSKARNDDDGAKVKFDKNIGCHLGFLHPNDGFDRLLNDKLKRSCSSSSSSSSSRPPSQDLNNNNTSISTPTVVISDDESRLDVNNNNHSDVIIIKPTGQQENICPPLIKTQESSPKDKRPRKKPKASTETGGNNETTTTTSTLITRRKSLAQQDQQQNLLLVQDRFRLAPNPLPSCPPSPNLNRHCTECIRMRQEARLDLVEEEIRQEAEKYHVPQPMKEGKFKSKLTSPLRWFRQQLGSKHSYRFQQETQSVPKFLAT